MSTSAASSSSSSSSSSSTRAPRARRWCFTLNNPVTTELAFPDKVKYAIYQLEQGESGTPHLQGYLEADTTVSLPWLKNSISPRAHWEPARGSQQSNVDYCSKEQGRLEGPWTFGKKSAQGQRSDLAQACDLVLQHGGLLRAMEECPTTVARYGRGLQLVDALNKGKKRNREGFIKPTIEVRFGDSGVGKTRYFFDNYPGMYVNTTHAEPGTLWFDGYDGEDEILFDDFNGGIPFRQFLRLLDGYPMRVQIKGTFAYVLATRVFITSNHAPWEWYKKMSEDGKDVTPLYRRLHDYGTVIEMRRNDFDDSQSGCTETVHSMSHWAKYGCPPASELRAH